MSDDVLTQINALKDQLKKLNARATQAKMDLHDLSEELPTNWQQIMDVAQKTFDAHEKLFAARTELKALEKEAQA